MQTEHLPNGGYKHSNVKINSICWMITSLRWYKIIHNKTEFYWHVLNTHLIGYIHCIA